MAKPTNVRVEYRFGATIALPNYQNIKPEYTISADVPEGMNPAEVRAKLKATVDAWLNEDIEALQKEARFG